MTPIERQTFDGRDFLCAHGHYQRLARTDGIAIQVNGAGATKAHAATELRAGQPQSIPKDPQQRSFGRSIDFVCFAIYCQIHSRHVVTNRMQSKATFTISNYLWAG